MKGTPIYYSIHSGLYMLDANASVKHISDYVSVAALYGDTLYCIGNENEFDWSAPKAYKAWKCSGGTKTSWTLPVDAAALYSLVAINADTFLVGDAGDYFNPGSISCYNKGSKLWTVTAGVCPGHFAIW